MQVILTLRSPIHSHLSISLDFSSIRSKNSRHSDPLKTYSVEHIFKAHQKGELLPNCLLKSAISPWTDSYIFQLTWYFMPMEFCESDNGNGCGRHFPKKSSPGLCAKCNKLASLSEGSVDYELWKVCYWILFEFSFLFSDAFWTAIIRPISNASLVALPGRTWLLPNVDVVLLQTFLGPTVVSPRVLKWVSWFGFYLGAVWHWPLMADAQNLACIALETSGTARANAMEAHLTKQPAAPPGLHTTAGLSVAKSHIVTGDNKVFIEAQCRIKTVSLHDQKHTDPGCGQWGKPWPNNAYMSGAHYHFTSPFT